MNGKAVFCCVLIKLFYVWKIGNAFSLVVGIFQFLSFVVLFQFASFITENIHNTHFIALTQYLIVFEIHIAYNAFSLLWCSIELLYMYMRMNYDEHSFYRSHDMFLVFSFCYSMHRKIQSKRMEHGLLENGL